jgi:hypothetical protein
MARSRSKNEYLFKAFVDASSSIAVILLAPSSSPSLDL